MVAHVELVRLRERRLSLVPAHAPRGDQCGQAHSGERSRHRLRPLAHHRPTQAAGPGDEADERMGLSGTALAHAPARCGHLLPLVPRRGERRGGPRAPSGMGRGAGVRRVPRPWQTRLLRRARPAWHGDLGPAAREAAAGSPDGLRRQRCAGHLAHRRQAGEHRTDQGMPGPSGEVMPDMTPLSDALSQNLERQNPWWTGRSMPVLPPFRRWPFFKLRERLGTPLAPILAVRGPRQIGKTTLQMQVIQSLLDERVRPERILRVQFDDLPSFRGIRDGEPILRIVDWYEQVVLGQSLNDAARAGAPAYLFFDEVQNLQSWDVQLKSLVDASTARVMVTGSSALRIGLGRD
ncbi:MAG: hypothetical protein FJX72_20485, partial [Armatimonadetes bacterium]|nr:hypothetical protein [Armatimonadota bacterium]